MVPSLALVIPAAYHATQLEEHWHNGHPHAIDSLLGSDKLPSPDRDIGLAGLLTISRGTSILLLIVYIAYLYFQLKSHADLFEAPPSDEEEEGAKMNMVSAGVRYVIRSCQYCTVLLLIEPPASLLAVTLITSFCADWRKSHRTRISVLVK